MALLDKTHDNLKTIEQLILVKNIEYIQQERASILLDQVYNIRPLFNLKHNLLNNWVVFLFFLKSFFDQKDHQGRLYSWG